MNLSSFSKPFRVIIFGAGGIGRAFAKHLEQQELVEQLTIVSRDKLENPSEKTSSVALDSTNEDDLKSFAANINYENLALVIVTIGYLHNENQQPEKSLKDLDLENLSNLFKVNAITPILIAKHILPKMRRDEKSVFAALSARVGSISDNQIGGWYGYRASKSALNMYLKTAAIEHGRKHKQGIILGLHPGTVDTDLSKPFQSFVKPEKLFTPEYSAEKMLEVIGNRSVSDTGKIFDWDNKEIQT